MLYKIVLPVLFILFFSNRSHSQSRDNLKDINGVWEKFYMAYDSLDYKLMADIHSKDLIRISGGTRISDYNNYINNLKTSFETAKVNKVENNISLRFFERINNDSIASERGIYKLIRKDREGDSQTYYGQFHVLLKKENEQWKIILDYDSNEGKSIGQGDFEAAHGIKEIDKFSNDKQE
jgi:ketosteroid isomerase-like protein